MVQLFATGKEITATTSSHITDVSQYGVQEGGVLSSTSVTGFTITNNTGGFSWMRVYVTVPNLIPGQQYSVTYTTGGTALTIFSIRTNGLDWVWGGSPLHYATNPYTYSTTFIATQTTAVLQFWDNGPQPDGTTWNISDLSVTGDTKGWNGVTELEILKGSPFTLDFNFKDIKDLKSKGSHSYNFRLPSTPANDVFFGNYYEVGSFYADDNFSFNPFRRAECWVLKDTIEIFKGTLQLTNIYLRDKNTYEYECILFSSELRFGDTLKTMKFKDLDYTEWNHELTPTNVYNSYNALSIDGGNIVWSMWDYGIGHASNAYQDFFQSDVGSEAYWYFFTFNIRKLRPQVKLKALIDKVFGTSNFTYSSAFFDTAEFAKIYMDLNYNKTDSVASPIPNGAWSVFATNNSTQAISNSSADSSANIIDFPNEVSDVTNAWDTANSRWVCQADGYWKIRVKGTITPSITPPVTDSNLQINMFNLYAGTTPGGDTLIDEFENLSVGATGINFDQEITFYKEASATPVYAKLVHSTPGNNAVTWTLSNMEINIQAVDVQGDENIVYINNLFGGLSIEKWWKSIVTKFNLVIVPHKDDATHLLIEPYDDYVDTGETIDWSDKMDFTKDVQIIPPTKFCGKQVKFKDTPSEDYVYQALKSNVYDSDEPTFGEYIEPSIRNQFAVKDTEFTSIFSPTINYPLNASELDLGVYSCAIWNQDGDNKKNTGGVRLSFFHGTKELNNNMVYVLGDGDTFQTEGGTERSAWPFFSAYSQKDFTNGNTAYSLNWHETLNAPPQSWDALPSMGLAAKHWRDYIYDNFNVNSRMLTAYMRLTPRDISDFSFANIITLNGQNYRVNSIKGYSVNSTTICKVEFLLISKSTIVQISAVDEIWGGPQFYDCPYIIDYWDLQTGIGHFINTETGVSSVNEIDQTCCTALAYQWLETPNSVNGWYCYDQEYVPGPTEDDQAGRSTTGNVSVNKTNILVGTNNNVRGRGNKVTGNSNTIKANTSQNKIEGNNNLISGMIRNSNINGNNNSALSFQVQAKHFYETLQFRTYINSGNITGEYGQLLIDGDSIQSKGTTLKNAQSGQFIIKFTTDGTNPHTIGQYGIFDITDNEAYNSNANLNGIRFPNKTNVKIKVELAGVEATEVNETFANKCIINQTIILSNYVAPIVLYSNVDSSVIDTAFGTVVLEAQTISKPPFIKEGTAGFIQFWLETRSLRTAANWTLKVSYETTALNDLTNPAIADPTAITGCALWLDASNYNSIGFASSSGDNQPISEWRDRSPGANHILQASATYQPKWKHDLWNRPFIDFDGSTANLNNADADLLALANGNNTFIAVYKSDVTTAEYYGQVIMGCIEPTYTPRVGLRVNANGGTGAGSSDSIAYSSQSSSSSVNACNIPSAGVNDLSIVIGRRNGTAVKITDGNGNTNTGTTGADNTSVTDFCVGGATSSGTTDLYEFNGRIHELICYNVAITNDEVSKVITYLKNKWNIV